ncbi:hypothetical protein AAFC00_000952 [Neodothiora populina]
MATAQHLAFPNVPGTVATSDIGNDSPATSTSSLTSVESDTFDTVPDVHGGFMSKIDVNGILRYGSTDADDTGLSSVTSSGPIDGKRPFKSVESSSSSHVSFNGDDRPRKRIALSPESNRLSEGENVYHNIVNSSSQNLLFDPEPSITIKQKSKTAPAPALAAVTPRLKKASKINRLKTDVRPRASIPNHLSWEEYGRQCVVAANASRLNPYALHPGEYRLLRDHITQAQVTTYLNMRNGILRLWIRNPLVSVTKEEAAGCAKDTRFFDLAYISFKWLIRNGYINFGCVEVPKIVTPIDGRKRSVKQKTVAVIGAGMSGLGCARQLEALFSQLGDHWTDSGELPPKVVVLEGRQRIGGRVYSHPLRSQVMGSLPDGLRNTAEMGAQIVTGFEHGNPLNAIIRGQLGLRYHLMWDEVTMYDCDGKAVDHDRDMLVNKIHNDLLERTSDFRVKPTPVETLEGLPDFIDLARDPVESKMGSSVSKPDNAPAVDRGRQQAVPPGFAKLQGRTQVLAGNSSSRTAAQAVKLAGWQLRPGVSKNQSLRLKRVARTPNPTLGRAMDEAVRQYQNLVELTPQDMRLLNWHYADLEYANAAMVSNLSLAGHDQDSGNEFEGRHSEVVGGYIQVPRGLLSLPSRLNVRFNSTVKQIKYTANDPDGPATIECVDGHVVHADKVVLTSPLGVLKAESIKFEPSLPDWKQGAIKRMGFGLLNKVVLVFEQSFWDEKYDMFGLLNEAERKNSMDPTDYASRRGRFYLLWNCVKNSGRPMLIALMAGRAAHDVEITDTGVLLQEIMERLKATFSPHHVPAPVEVIVSRWKRDPFTRGTFSFVGPNTNPGDYDVMAAPVGNLHFAGEATCGTHPATVHGAYLSGLRAAGEVVDSMIGEIGVPVPLVQPMESVATDAAKPNQSAHSTASASPSAGTPLKSRTTKPAPAVVPTPRHINPYRSTHNSRATQEEEYETSILAAVLHEIGERPMKPGRLGVNPFLLFSTDAWSKCKADLTTSEDIAPSRNEVRAEIGRRWRVASDEEKQPYLEKCASAQRAVEEARAVYEQTAATWDRKAAEIRMNFIKANPFNADEIVALQTEPYVDVPTSRNKTAVDYAEVSEGEQ